MNTGNVRGILSELQANVAKKKNDLASLENKIQECQIFLDSMEIGYQELIEKVHSSFEEKEKILEDLKLKLQKSRDVVASLEAKNREIEVAMADKPMNEIEQSLEREQTRSMDLDEKEERLVLRQRLANRTK